MTVNYGLEKDEIENNFILTCQSIRKPIGSRSILTIPPKLFRSHDVYRSTALVKF